MVSTVLRLPACPFCSGELKLRRIFPQTWTLPELKAYQCNECGDERTVEHEQELLALNMGPLPPAGLKPNR
jgi:hypothetical protein